MSRNEFTMISSAATSSSSLSAMTNEELPTEDGCNDDDTTAADKISNDGMGKNYTKKRIPSTLPPWHSQLVAGIVLSSCFWIFQSSNSPATDATRIDIFTNVLFPQYFSLRLIIGIRFMFSLVIFSDCANTIFWGNWDQQTDYISTSKLQSITIPFRGILLQPDRSILRGLLTMTSFTMLSWLLLGISFFFMALIPTLHLLGKQVSPTILRTTMLAFECAAPTALLVSVVVKYVLWPEALQQGSLNSQVLKHPLALVEHNANSIMALVEVALMGGIPVRMSDIAVGPLFGILYVFFTWYMADKWTIASSDKHNKKNVGLQYIYPFFDITLGWVATLSLIVLLGVLCFFYYIFAAATEYAAAHSKENDFWIHVFAVIGIATCVCRFRD